MKSERWIVAVSFALVGLLFCAGLARASAWRIQKGDIAVIDATAWPTEIMALVDKWDDVMPLTLQPGPCEWKRGAIVLCSGHYGPSGAAGGLLDEKGNRIVAGKVAFNLDYSAYDVPELREWLLCHEFGHMLGLVHDDVPPTAPDAEYHHGCMNTVWQGEPNPSQYDLDQLQP